MNGKYKDELKALEDRGIDIWRPLFHRQYEGGFEGRIRRQYMDLARPAFYPKVFEKADIKPYETVLDLGCGDGFDIANLRASGHFGRIVGMETPVSENPDATEDKIELINHTVHKAGFSNFEVKIGYAEEMDFEDETFDTVWAANVLQEVSDVDRVLDHIFRILKPGGKLISVTNHKDNKPLHHSILRGMAARVGAVPPTPFSSKFNSVTGPKVMARHRHQFRFEHEIIQQGRKNLRLTSDEVPYLLASLSTYWPDFMPEKINRGETITRDEMMDFLYLLQSQRESSLRQVEADVLAAIDASPSGAVYETIKRVAIKYRKRSKLGQVIFDSTNLK
jgi:ubiquinone/menaquinone biosynthesis C-methylase UbiE